MRIAIALPVHRQTEAQFTLSLAGMVARAAATLPHELRTFMAQGTILDARNGLVEVALEWGADWILWLDADQTFGDDTLNRLLGHDLDFVGCNYPRRRPSDAPTAVKDGKPHYTTALLAKAGLVEPVDSIGLGVCLVRASVFRAIERPWFNWDRSPSGNGHVSEDVGFCRAVRKAGIAVHLDHALSWEVGHIAEQILTNEGTGRGYVTSSVHAPAGAK